MMNKISFLKNIDKLIGGIASILVKLLIPSRKFQNKSTYRFLVIRPGGIGDAVLLYPSLKILKNNFKDSKIDILAEKRNVGIFNGCKYIENLYLYDDFKNLGLFKALYNKYDVVIDTEQWHRLSAVIAFITRAPLRIGFSTNEREKLFTNPVNYSQEDYEAISFLRLISEITRKKHKFNYNSRFLDVDKNLSIKFRAELDEYKKNYSYLVGIFAGATVRERRWGVKNFALLASQLLERKIGVVLIGDKNDIKDAEVCSRILENKAYFNYVGKTSLAETTSIISLLDLFISADTGLMHIAYGVGTKTLSLFGAGIQEKWSTRGGLHSVINKKLHCSPCTKFGYTPSCPYNVKCLNEISVEEVFDKSMEIRES